MDHSGVFGDAAQPYELVQIQDLIGGFWCYFIPDCKQLIPYMHPKYSFTNLEGLYSDVSDETLSW